MADFLKADVTILRRVSVESTQQVDTSITEDGSGTSGVVRRRLSTNIGSPRTDPEYLVVEAQVTSRLAEEHHFLEIRVALIGGPDAGKSTLLGRLAHGIADNGRGKARMYLYVPIGSTLMLNTLVKYLEWDFNENRSNPNE
jgi:predicted GTPase